MRIVYGVFGYGRGHATRALGLLPELLRRHEVLVLAGGDAQAALQPTYPVVEIPTLRFVYGRSGKRSTPATFGANFGPVWDLLTEGPRFRKLRERVRAFDPEVAICDADPWTHRVAASLHVPRISLDHFGVLAYCRPPIAAQPAPAAGRSARSFPARFIAATSSIRCMRNAPGQQEPRSAVARLATAPV
jgi:UDP:flavonoid glycosyltransferase YjiC (YdhE family)